MNKEYLDFIYAISLVIGIFGGLFYGIQILYKNFKTAQKKRRQQLIGAWTNEGSIGNNETHYLTISLDLDLEDGEVVGLVEYVRSLKDDEEFKNISLNGNFFWRTSKLRMSIVKQGEVFDCGYLKIRRQNHKRMEIVSKSVVERHFPRRTTLWKG
ncbi:hypothetical protein [Algoriphagus terrigena]|uniref:hypothetical protein n=1 Tax=Algoriphagus terrigena TaxID=344884 RepID=UPI00047A3383|nr:hypothetical protein [Algoriphagus terrigena]